VPLLPLGVGKAALVLPRSHTNAVVDDALWPVDWHRVDRGFLSLRCLVLHVTLNRGSLTCREG
jgi:hypothetical protein